MLVITEGECEALLEADVKVAEEMVRRMVPSYVLMCDVRQRALVNMAFNLGGRLGGFGKFLAAVERKDWETASKEMLNSLWAKQVGQRAVRLARMMRVG